MPEMPAPDAAVRVSGGGAVAIAMGVMSVAAYGFTVVAARVLGPEPYGAFAALMGLLLVVNVLSLGMQATAARRISAVPSMARSLEPAILRVSYWAGGALALVCLVLSPLIKALLSLDGLSTVILIALAAVPLTVTGAQAGILQGERRWGSLAAVYLAIGVGRLGVGSAMILWRPTEFAAMLGVALGAVVPVVVGWSVLRAPRASATAQVPHSGGLIKEAMHNSHALLAFFALSNVDVVMARVVLDPQSAGLYAAGLIMTKAVLFLPQFVVVIAFPDMASSGRRNAYLPALVAIALVGAAATLGAALLPDLAVTFVGGEPYADLAGLMWAFAAVGTILAMLQLMIYGVVARQHRRVVSVPWAATALLTCGALWMGTQGQLIATAAAADGAALVVLLIFLYPRRLHGKPAEDASRNVA